MEDQIFKLDNSKTIIEAIQPKPSPQTGATTYWKNHHLKDGGLHYYKISNKGTLHICTTHLCLSMLSGIPVMEGEFSNAEMISFQEFANARNQVLGEMDCI